MGPAQILGVNYYFYPLQSCIGQRVYSVFYVFVLFIFLFCLCFAVILCEMDRRLSKRSRDVGRKCVSGWEKKKKKEANEVTANKQKGALHKFLKHLKPESENMATSTETAKTDSVKNAEIEW